MFFAETNGRKSIDIIPQSSSDYFSLGQIASMMIQQKIDFDTIIDGQTGIVSRMRIDVLDLINLLTSIK
jgi:hypothetical protein